ncbi:MAG TPA: hypothetical protein VEJ43_09095 [Pseudolabrys sp.]|nr:hypothetical protein [Pseudolabrys sp.]
MVPNWQRRFFGTFWFSVTVGAAATFIRRRLVRYNGTLRTTKYLPGPLKTAFATYYACQERIEIALMVANQYPGGDYFEFGSEGFYTFCNFLSAFDINGHTKGKPDVKFYAFDIFGEPKPDSQLSNVEKPYFAVYEGLGSYHYKRAEVRLRKHAGPLLDRCVQVKGHYEDTLNDSFKAQLRAENRRVGFAFLDCNIASSYQTVLDFLEDFVHEDRVFIYLDEYFQTQEVPQMFDAFCRNLGERYGLRSHYIRNAGAYGALFLLMREPKPAAASRKA